ISRLRVHDMSAAPSYNIAIGNVGSGSGTGGMHKKHVTFHHPKIPANWHFTQYDGAHDYSGSVAAQMATYKGPGTKDLEDSGAIDISDAALAQIDSEGYIQSNFIFFDRADQSIYHTTATSRPGPRPGTNAKADPAYDALNPADYSVSLNFGLRWGRVRHLPGSTYTFRYTNLIDLAAIVGTSSVWDYFAPCSSHFFDYAEKRNRNLAHRWIENTSFAGVRTLYYPNNAVVHRPIPGTSKWSYIYYLPKYYTVNGISNSLVQGIMNSRTAQEPYSSNHYLFYTKVQGWVIPPGDSDDPPEGVGFNDVNFFSNVLTLEQIKSIVGEDENFLDGLGVT
ncbi:MAG: hypothetical protein KAJ19_21490, partial [Gammaproteobacteria bacterium]|nr:hypothetical protein [Gammaproteobacteria bacterium]